MKTLDKRLAVLGLGKMGGILLQAFLEKGLIEREKTFGTDKYPERAEALGKEFGIQVCTDNAEAARHADVILLCVKPQTVKEVAEVIRPVLTPDKLIISIAASVPSSYIEKSVGGEIPVVRCMPNTPCVIGYGMTGICKGRYANQGHL